MIHTPIASLLDTAGELDAIEAASLLAAHSHETIHDVLAGLPTDKALQIASYLSGAASQQASESVELAHGVKGEVSELMVPAIGVLPPETTIAGALDYLVHAQPVTGITYIYIVDDGDHLLGVLAMRDLLLGRPGQTLMEIMTAAPFTFTPDTTIPDAVNAALTRRHRLYPVTDESGKLLGLVYGWRLFEYVATEISAQSGSMVGVDSEERVDTPILEAFRMRHPWLQVNLLTAFCAAFVVGIFESTIAQIVALAVFLPVLAGQSGNTGCQALAITLRGLTLGELSEHSVGRLLRKEIILGGMNGFFVGLVAAAAMWVYAGQTGVEQPLLLALVVLIAMVGACMGSGAFGILVPLTLRRFGADPAMASSIFLTTFTDILGMGLMLLLATSIVL
ncbi:MAG: magnesium transporter [Halioglobus sp.]|nr:magnesium transporter [Halioglobus sp.]